MKKTDMIACLNSGKYRICQAIEQLGDRWAADVFLDNEEDETVAVCYLGFDFPTEDDAQKSIEDVCNMRPEEVAELEWQVMIET